MLQKMEVISGSLGVKASTTARKFFKLEPKFFQHICYHIVI